MNDSFSDPSEGRWWVKSGVGGHWSSDRPDEVIDKVIASFKTWHDQRRAKHAEYVTEYGVSKENFGLTTNRPHVETLEYQHATNVIDTVVTKVCKSQIVPMALTSGGSWGERKRAKGFNRFISGLFWEAGVFENDFRWTTDCLVKDCGVAKVVLRGGRVRVERCDPDNIYWDPGEALLTGKVRTIYEEHFIDRFQLLSMMDEWGCSKELCDYVRELRYEGKDDPVYNSPHNQDLVRVREAWHLPSGKGADDGKHAMCVKGATLLLEEYDSELLPHVILTNKFAIYGLTAPPLMAKLLGPQREYNRVQRKLQESHALLGVPRLLVRRGAKLNKAELDDVPGSIVYVDTLEDVKEWNAAPASPDTYHYAEGVLADMEKSAGLPDTNLQGKPPEGISAAKALQLLDDIVAEKLTQMIRCRERFYTQIAELALECTRKATRGGDYTVLAETKEGRQLDKVKLADVDINVGSYKLKVFPTSFLSQSPSARYEFLSEMRQRNDIDEGEFRQLVDMPDLESENDLETSTIDIIDQNIDAIMNGDTFPLAEAFDDHVLIVQRGSKAYNLARLRAPKRGEKEYDDFQERLRALKEYVMSAKFYLEPPEEAAPDAVDAGGAPMNAMGGAPGMQPGMIPTDQGMLGMVPQGPLGPPPIPVAPGTPQPMNPFTPQEALSNG